MIRQPSPVATDARPTWELVIADLERYRDHDPTVEAVIDDAKARDALGRERYGVPLQAGNGRDSAWDAYEESLDYAAYLKTAVIESEQVEGWPAVLLRLLYTRALDTCIRMRGLVDRRCG